MPLRLPCLQRHATLVSGVASQVQVVVMHGRQLRARAVEMAVRRRDACVVVKAVLVPRLEAADTEAAARDIGVNVVVVNIVVTLEVTFQPVCSVHEKVVMCVEVLRGIVIVDGLMAVVVGEHKVLRDFSWSWRYGLRETVAYSRDVDLPTPGVKGPVICSLAAAVENKIAQDVIVSAKLVVKIYMGSGPIVKDVCTATNRHRSTGAQLN